MRIVAYTMMALFIGAILAPVAQAKMWRPADGETIVFAVYSGDKQIGAMDVSFARPVPGTLIVTRQQRIEARKFMFSVKMNQIIVEQWQGSQLVKMQADTSIDTPVQDMVIDAAYHQNNDGALVYKNDETSHIVEAGLWPSTLWHGGFLKQQRFFQPPNGLPVDISFVHEGVDAANKCHKFTANSTPEEGEAAEFTLWFERSGKPCRMQFTSPMGPLDYVVQ